MPEPRQPDHDYRDALASGPVRGRGSNLNPGNRFETIRLHVLGEHLDEIIAENPDGTQVRTTILPDRTRSVINPVDSPDLPMKWTINPYRGCEHGCIYCYARPGHEYLGMSSGLDFETRIMAKLDAPEILRRELARPSWSGEPIVLSGVTDPYQPIESKLGLTRRILEICVEHFQPLAFITKSSLILRDLDLLDRLRERQAVRVSVSLTTLDPALAAAMEPRAASPAGRLRTIETLARAGIPVNVMTAPIIPAINDREIPALLRAARDAGATSAAWVLLRLPHQIKALFLEWLARHVPDRAAHVESLIRQTRDGDLYTSEFFDRRRGTGPIAEQIAQTFRVFARRYRLDRGGSPLNSSAFRRPDDLFDSARPDQLRLF
ncbi:MAG: PA0069 family radical SAM protein [Phycisphaerae bacterium]|nr:PA0069 family radical SAM protein [Phycisphaerae bacterium]